MQFQRLPGELANHIYSFATFKERALCIGQLNKESNKIIDADLEYFDNWLFNLFVWHSRKLLITDWLKIPGSIPIEPLVRNIDGSSYCICLIGIREYSTIEEFVNAHRNRFSIIFTELNKKCGHDVWCAEEGKFHVPDWKHFMFQKEIIEFCEELKLSDRMDKILVGLFEFIEVVMTTDNNYHMFVNFQKRELAFINFVSRSQMVRNRFKKVFPVADNHQLLAMDYALKLGMSNYNSQLLIL